ncbi:AraC family transcriptional regulator ligand-binding domain-containing protein [Ottowia sp.]|uniref:AraC family transcriptional regulator n=1 Tax=Ottowia sp. TaxID=1898956 RepID=UPI003A8BFCAE
MTKLIRSSGLSGYEELAAEWGLDVAHMARRAGLTIEALRDPGALIPYRALMQLLEQSARDTGRADFGLRLSLRQNLRILGPLSVAMENAATMADAMRLGSRYVFVHSPAISFNVEPVDGHSEATDLRFEIQIVNTPERTQTLELSLGVIVQIVRLLSQGRITPLAVLLPHAPVSLPEVYAQCFGCACRFEQAYAAVRVSTAALAQPLTAHNPMLSELARSYLEQHYVNPGQTMTDRVATLVRQFLSTQRAGRTDIARMLAMHPRTMQRRLRDEGTTFENIKDAVRKDLLEEILRRRTVPTLAQIATMLDYGAQSALTRSCRRWFGVTPSALVSAHPAPAAKPGQP